MGAYLVRRLALMLLTLFGTHLAPAEQGAILLMCCVPMAGNTVVIANQLQMHPEKAATAVMASTLLAMASMPGLLLLIRAWQHEGLSPLFDLDAESDMKSPDTVIAYASQGGLGLPDRDYYVSNDPKMVEARNGYKTYIANLLTAAGISDAQARAARIFALETKIAQAHATKAETADFTAGGTLWKRADFAAKAPGMDWWWCLMT